MPSVGTNDLGHLLIALDARSISDAAAELDSMLRLAENACDELHMLASCTADFPDGRLPELLDRAARAVDEATDELRALRFALNG
jgi:hypothetical protein